MRLDMNALLKAGGIGAAVVSAAALLSNTISLLAPRLSTISLACCCFNYLFFAAVGAGYAWFAQQNRTPLAHGPMALGGALAAALAALAQGVVNVAGTAVAASQGALAPFMSQFQPPPGMVSTFQAGFVMGLLGGLVMAVLAGAVIGAASGATYVALVKDTRPG